MSRVDILVKLIYVERLTLGTDLAMNLVSSVLVFKESNLRCSRV